MTTLPPSCADCLEIWEPTGTLRACPGLCRDCLTLLYTPRTDQMRHHLNQLASWDTQNVQNLSVCPLVRGTTELNMFRIQVRIHYCCYPKQLWSYGLKDSVLTRQLKWNPTSTLILSSNVKFRRRLPFISYTRKTIIIYIDLAVLCRWKKRSYSYFLSSNFL